MNAVTELVRRAERLQDHVEMLRTELAQMRRDLDRLQTQTKGNASGPSEAGADCLTVALALAEDLGPHFSAENPDELAGRGDNWFQES